MAERWRKPVTILGIEPAPEVVAIGDVLYQEEEVILHPADAERLKQGHVCPQCFEPIENPDTVTACPLGIPGCCMESGRRLDYMNRAFKGTTWIGPRESYEDELAALDEKNQRRKHRPDSHIWVPRSARKND